MATEDELMTKSEEKRAAELLKKCKALEDAEKYFGGSWDQKANARDHKKAAVAWGLFDGWHGRPCTHAGLHGTHESSYKHHYSIGRRLSIDEIPA